MSLREELKKETNVAITLAVFLVIMVSLIFWLVLQAIPTSKSVETEEDHIRKIRINGWRYAQLTPEETNSSGYDDLVANIARKIYDVERGLFDTYQNFLPCDSASDCSEKLLLPDLVKSGITVKVAVAENSCFLRAVIKVDHSLAKVAQVKIITVHTCPPWMDKHPYKTNT